MRWNHGRRLIAGAGAAAALGIAASPALAASRTANPYAPAATTPAAFSPLASMNQTNGFYGGEAGAPADGVSSVSATFVVPSFKCPVDAENFYGNAIFDADGDTQAGSALGITCAGGIASYVLDADTFDGGDQQATSGVSPGDLIVVSDYETTSNTVATVTDETSGVSATSQDGVGDASGEPSADFNSGIFDDSGTIAQFKTIQFTHVQVNGEHLAQTDPTALDLESGNDRQIVTTPPSKSYGSRFILTFKHAS